MDHSKDLFLKRVPWLDVATVEATVEEELQDLGNGHFVRGNAWRSFEFIDVVKEDSLR